LIPKYGKFVAAGIKVSSWLIRKADERNGKKGIAIIKTSLPLGDLLIEDPYSELVSILTRV